jgi:rfaE bifunctional protein kinase chain/domain
VGRRGDRARNGDVVPVSLIDVIHSRDLASPSEALVDYLPGFWSRHGIGAAREVLARATSLRALVVGETIIDEYQYVETIGKAGKEPILAARYLATESFAGGVLAVANHVAAVTPRVDLVTALGVRDSQEAFVRERLAAGVAPRFVYLDDAPTIVKRRFIEAYPGQKLFEVYVMGDDGEAPREHLTAALADALADADVVVVADYGHGLLSGEVVELLCDRARYLAVNTQMNAANRGFNTVSKYRRADYVCVSENELRLEVRSRGRGIRDVAEEVAERLGCSRLLATRGEQGVVAYDRADGFYEIPGFASRIVDRVGAGDAVLAVTALCAAAGAPIELIGMIGNTVGAEMVSTVGNSEAVRIERVIRHFDSLSELA